MDGVLSGEDTEPCTEERKEELRQEFEDVMRQLDEAFGLCDTECDYSNIEVTCDGETARRRKRDTKTAFTINFSIPVDKYVFLVILFIEIDPFTYV